MEQNRFPCCCPQCLTPWLLAPRGVWLRYFIPHTKPGICDTCLSADVCSTYGCPDSANSQRGPRAGQLVQAYALCRTHALGMATLRRTGLDPSPTAPWHSVKARFCSNSSVNFTKPQPLEGEKKPTLNLDHKSDEAYKRKHGKEGRKRGGLEHKGKGPERESESNPEGRTVTQYDPDTCGNSSFQFSPHSPHPFIQGLLPKQELPSQTRGRQHYQHRVVVGTGEVCPADFSDSCRDVYQACREAVTDRPGSCSLRSNTLQTAHDTYNLQRVLSAGQGADTFKVTPSQELHSTKKQPKFREG